MTMNTAPEAPATETVRGEISTITYRNSDTGYSILRIAVRGQREPVTVVGTSLAAVGELVEATGQWKVHATFGRQLAADSIMVSRPTSASGIQRYLASGAVRGIGPKLAERIVKTFGDKTLDVLDNAPEKLASIKGISEQRAADIATVWQASQGERQLQVYLASHGIMGALALRIIKKYAGATIDVVERQPYRLAKEVTGIGFPTADAIALKLGMPHDSLERVVAGLRHVVTTGTGLGHCGIPRDRFLQQAAELLGLPVAFLLPAVDDQIAKREFLAELVQDGQRQIFDKRLLDAERRIATALRNIDTIPAWSITPDKARKIAAEAEQACGMTLEPEQYAAVEMALLRTASILTGGPGTGKTSTLKVVLAALNRVGARVILGAPTGKAAKRMTESTGQAASTVARLIGMGRPSDAPPTTIDCDILILDEASMVDVVMLDKVLACLTPGASILFVGDVDQLPSVSAGRVLADMIESGKVPTVCLTRIFRQAAQSAIIRNAHRINRGEGIEAQGVGACDFYFIDAEEPEAAAAWITRLVQQDIPQRIGIPANEVQVLAPMRKGGTGTEALNARIQEALNPNPAAFVTRMGRRYGVGDRVLQLVNNYDLGVMNGESGIITAVDNEGGKVTVDVDGLKAEYPFSDLDQLDLAYAMTVHKSQGSQFPAVVMPITTQHYMMLQRSILYTAVTRAARFCVLVGQRKALNMAIENARAEPRITALKRMLTGQWAEAGQWTPTAGSAYY